MCIFSKKNGKKLGGKNDLWDYKTDFLTSWEKVFKNDVILEFYIPSSFGFSPFPSQIMSESYWFCKLFRFFQVKVQGF